VLSVCRFVAVNGLDPDLGAPGPCSENGSERRIFLSKCKNLSATNYAGLLTFPTRRRPAASRRVPPRPAEIEFEPTPHADRGCSRSLAHPAKRALRDQQERGAATPRRACIGSQSPPLCSDAGTGDLG
jgi:hypothetical protein